MMKTDFITINKRKIGSSYPVYIIAEMSANHNQSLDTAIKIIEEAKEAGANAIKLQTYTPETITIESNNKYFKIKGTPWDGLSLFELYKKAYTPWQWFPKLKDIADSLKIDFFSTPFDHTAYEFLEKLKVPAYKIASFENIDLPLISLIAKSKKPIIISTGMASLGEIDDVVNTVRSNNDNNNIALLKCTSAYPAPVNECNLNTITDLSNRYQLPVGLSDHTLDNVVPITAVALGACIIEKHFTLSRSIQTPDRSFSLEPHEFKSMVTAVRTTEQALGKVNYQVTANEKQNIIFRRSLFVVEDIKAGESITKSNVRSIRPGYGLYPKYLNDVIGLKAKRDITKGTPLTWELIDN